MKICNCDDGTYVVETAPSEMLGFILSSDNAQKTFTFVMQILDGNYADEYFKFMCTGDILISVNERLVVEEQLDSIIALLDILSKGGLKRRFKFLNPRKLSVVSYLKKMESNKAGSQIDMFGFNCSFEYRLDEQAFRNLQFNTTNQRDLEWVEYLKSIGGPENLKPVGIFKPSPDLKAIVRRGIPVAFRSIVWQKISLSSVYRLQYPSDYYNTLQERVKSELSAKVKDDIEKDIDRTFPEHDYFESSGQGENGLRRVLQAFALHNTDVGYCQSLNFIAGMMLIFMQEEDAFWLLVTIVEHLLPMDYYTRSMVGTYVDQFVLAHIVKKYLPKIHDVFDAQQLQLPLITVQWFMCLFVNTLRPEVTLRVWDMFLNEGSKVLFRISAALFKLQEHELCNVKDGADLFTALRNIGKNISDPDILIAAAYKSHPNRVTAHKKLSKHFSFKLPTRTHSPTFKLDRPQSFNPRLKTASFRGIVPKNLTGVGLAHLGPLTPDNTNSSSDSNNNNIDHSNGSGSNSGHTSAESSGHSEGIVVEEGQQQSQSSETTPDAKHGVVIPSPQNSSPSPMNADFKFKPRRKGVSANGELNFCRADIELWRCSFRPALEERFVTMEAARKTWRADNNISGKKDGGDQKLSANNSVEDLASPNLTFVELSLETNETTTAAAGGVGVDVTEEES